MRILLIRVLLGCVVIQAMPGVSSLCAAQEEIDSQEVSVEGEAFFQRLVDRYGRITHYIDRTRIEEVIEDAATGAPPIRTTTKLKVEFRDERLDVARPGLLQEALDTVVEAQEDISGQDLWLLPHMALRFTDDPLMEFRRGIDDGFEPTGVGMVGDEEQPLVRLELTSRAHDENGPLARFELFVDPQRMLVERVIGEQQLADGLAYRVQLEIEPVHVYDSPDSPDLRDREGSEGDPVQALSG